MACEFVSCNGAVFVLWGKPTRKSMDLAFTELRLTAEKTGHPVVYITRVPPDAPPPDAEGRAYLDRLMPTVLDWASTYHVVLEGTGFVNAVKRGVIVSMFQIRWRRGTFFVHSTTGEVIHNVPKEAKQDVANVLELARARGLLSKSAPITIPPSARVGDPSRHIGVSAR
jgi:hypothetical protein